MVDINELKIKIDTIGSKINELKSVSNVDKNAIGDAVKELLECKQLYADNNNGIGVDGKLYEPPLTKAQKKAKAKAEKAAAAAKSNDVDNNGDDAAKGVSKNEQKKAAKKAAAKAKKEAMKAAAKGGGGGSTGGDGGGNKGDGAKKNAAAAAKTTPTAPSPQQYITNTSGLQERLIVINPNLPLTDRPVVSLSVAILSNTILDYKIISDHRFRQSCLTLEKVHGENNNGENGGVVQGDLAMARCITRNAIKNKKVGSIITKTIAEQALVDSWVDYAQSLATLSLKDRIKLISQALEHALAQSTYQTYLIGNEISLADICIFKALGFPSQTKDMAFFKANISSDKVATLRYVKMISQSPAIKEATQLAVGIVNNLEAVFHETDTEEQPLLEPLVPGMNALEGAIAGRVVTRFPPEPSGYLHIGHAKAVLLNDYYARRYKGRLIVRFDDTNPSKEKEEFQQSIIEDLQKLGVKPDMVTFTSDYFATIKGYAKYLITNQLAYMDDTPQETMKIERAERKDSKHRNQSVEEAMEYFDSMCSGSEEGAKWCLRAKIDMQSDNGTMRDPVLYRQNLTPHHRAGTTYKAYPTYDLACPIVDSLEGVTHALRTTEYNDRDEQYAWIQNALQLRHRVRIHAFSRVNFTHTVLSKRKLTWFVENGKVTGWDDARFPTVRGVVRRGVNIKALKAFMYSQGASRRVVNMVWNTFWAENKKEIDKYAGRYMAIDKDNHAMLTITNASSADNQYVTTQIHPKDPKMGNRAVRISQNVLLESVDVEGIVVGESIVLMRWGVVNITKVSTSKVDGKEVVALEGTYDPEGDFKAAKRKISWIANAKENNNNATVILTEFDNLLSKEKLDEDDNFEDFLNPNTLAVTNVIGDPGLKLLKQNDIIQLERRGYYRVDRPYISKDKPIILYMIPDGKTKAMSGLQGKLAHR